MNHVRSRKAAPYCSLSAFSRKGLRVPNAVARFLTRVNAEAPETFRCSLVTARPWPRGAGKRKLEMRGVTGPTISLCSAPDYRSANKHGMGVYGIIAARIINER
jgi:hypothetical protein